MKSLSLRLVGKRYHLAWLFDYPAVLLGPKLLGRLVDRLSNRHYSAERTMCSEPVPRGKRHSIVNSRRSRLAPSDLWFDCNPGNRPIRTDFLRPHDRSVLNRHKFNVGAQLRPNLPFTAIFFEKIYNCYSQP